MRITAACPEALVADANHLAMCLAFGPADGATYGALSWQDGAGNLYAAASWEAGEDWIAAAQAAPVRPDWDTGQIVDMAAAARAQAALVFRVATGDDPAPPAAPGRLTALAGMDGPAALAAMGLRAAGVAPSA